MTQFIFPFAGTTYSISVSRRDHDFMFWPSNSNFSNMNAIPMTEREVYDMFNDMTVDELERAIGVGYERFVYMEVHKAIQNLKMNEW